MSPGSYIEAWISSADFSDRYQLRTKQTNQDNGIAEDITNKIDASTGNDKLDFFRSMGLRFTNFCDINCNNNDYDPQTNHKRSFRSSSRISESFYDIAEENFDFESKLKNNKTRDMVGYRKIIPFMRECRVTIIGEKCKICGRSFKCIRDVQIHVKKKHRRKKPRKKLVLRIGDEVISRVPIKRKHLKFFHKEKHRTIDYNNDDVTYLSNEEELRSEQISDEDNASIVVRNGDTKETRYRSIDTEKSDILLENSIDTPKLDEKDDEDVQVVLKITRPRKSMEINHETPNRTERERLISDAIQEFIRMDNEIDEIIEPACDNLRTLRKNNEIVVAEYSPLADGTLPNDNLDCEENNCSFHIENESDVDSCNQELDFLLSKNNKKLYNDETASISSQHYRNENGDIIPDFIDYTHCLKDSASHNHNNNNIYELESLYYNEARINEWNNGSCDLKDIDFDIHQNTSRSLMETSVLIKEEIMLDDLL